MPPTRVVVDPTDIQGGIAANVHADGASHTLWMRSEHLGSTEVSDLTSWAMTMLPYAMRRSAALHLHGSIDEVVLRNMNSIQRVLHGWFPKRLSVVDVIPERTHTSSPSDGRSAFFSGGVDSFYTLATATPPLDAVVFVGGFDIPIDKPDRVERATPAVHAAASEFGASMLALTTNMRSLTDPVTSWGYEQHGASLAAVSYALRAHFGTVHIASSYSDEDLHPWGSHPDLDPLWSSSAQTILHDSTVELRVEKVAQIMQYQSARAGLRVCWMDTDEYNCGTCEKCVRTRINLRATGNDGACATLPELQIDEVRSMRLADSGARLFAEENLRFLHSSSASDPELSSALEDAIRRGRRQVALISVGSKIPGVRAVYRAAKRALG